MAEQEACASAVTEALAAAGATDGAESEARGESLLLPLLQGLLGGGGERLLAGLGAAPADVVADVRRSLARLRAALAPPAQHPQARALLALAERLEDALDAADRLDGCRRRPRRRSRANRHTVGVTHEELEEARRLVDRDNLALGAEPVSAASRTLPSASTDGSTASSTPERKGSINEENGHPEVPRYNKAPVPETADYEPSPQVNRDSRLTVEKRAPTQKKPDFYRHSVADTSPQRIPYHQPQSQPQPQQQAPPPRTEVLAQQQPAHIVYQPQPLHHTQPQPPYQSNPQPPYEINPQTAYQTQPRMDRRPSETKSSIAAIANKFDSHARADKENLPRRAPIEPPLQRENSREDQKRAPLYYMPLPPTYNFAAPPTALDDSKPLNRFGNSNNKRLRMKRANTIDIGRPLAGYRMDSDNDEDASPRPLVPEFRPQTENDRKFVAFMKKNEAAADTGTGHANWSSRFGNIKNAFESREREDSRDHSRSSSASSARRFWRGTDETTGGPTHARPKKFSNDNHNDVVKPPWVTERREPTRVQLPRQMHHQSQPGYPPMATRVSAHAAAPARIPETVHVPAHTPARAPTHVPSHVSSHVPSHVQSYVSSHVPSQVPSHVTPHVPSHVPPHVPSHIPSHAPAHVPAHAPTLAPASGPVPAPARVPVSARVPMTAPVPTLKPSPIAPPTQVPNYPVATPALVPISAPPPPHPPVPQSPTKPLVVKPFAARPIPVNQFSHAPMSAFKPPTKVTSPTSAPAYVWSPPSVMHVTSPTAGRSPVPPLEPVNMPLSPPAHSAPWVSSTEFERPGKPPGILSKFDTPKLETVLSLAPYPENLPALDRTPPPTHALPQIQNYPVKAIPSQNELAAPELVRKAEDVKFPTTDDYAPKVDAQRLQIEFYEKQIREKNRHLPMTNGHSDPSERKPAAQPAYTVTDFTLPGGVSTFVPLQRTPDIEKARAHKVDYLPDVVANDTDRPRASPRAPPSPRPAPSPVAHNGETAAEEGPPTEHGAAQTRVMRGPVRGAATLTAGARTREQHARRGSAADSLRGALDKLSSPKNDVLAQIERKKRDVSRSQVRAPAGGRSPLPAPAPPHVRPPLALELTASRESVASSESGSFGSNPLSRSGSWHQVAGSPKSASPRRVVARAKSMHLLAVPKLYEGGIAREEVTEKKRTVEAFFSTSAASRAPAAAPRARARPQPGGYSLGRSRTMPAVSELQFLDESNTDDAFEDLVSALA